MATQEERDRILQKAMKKAAFKRAKEKDDRAENGVTTRVDFLLDQMLKEQNDKN